MTPHLTPNAALGLLVPLQGRLGETKSHGLHSATWCCTICPRPSFRRCSEWGNLSRNDCTLEKLDLGRKGRTLWNTDVNLRMLHLSLVDEPVLAEAWDSPLCFQSFHLGLGLVFVIWLVLVLLFLVSSGCYKICRLPNKEIVIIRKQGYEGMESYIKCCFSQVLPHKPTIAELRMCKHEDQEFKATFN